VERATAVEPATVVNPATTVEAAATVGAATSVEAATACVRAVVHLRVSGSDTSENRARRDTCYCEFLHWRLSHSRTFLTPEK
jgi:hypothetical protein